VRVELVNATRMIAGYTMGLRPDGRELLVVVVKGTFTIPTDDRPPELADQQVELVMADEFTGEPGLSAAKYESDFAPFKPRCDVLLNGSAYAPRGRPVARVNVSMRVGTCTKSFKVVGNRSWMKIWLLTIPGAPAPFTVMPISYDNAFGGADLTHSDPKKHRTFLKNHVGKGFHYNLTKGAVDGKPLPNTEELRHPVNDPRRNYRPMAFGPIARVWQPRLKFAGTYDQNWQDSVFPFLPADFDNRYYQAAPLDQQIDYLRGGEDVVLLNLTPQGKASFKVPSICVPVRFCLKNGEEIESVAVNDTIIIEPDFGRFVLVWRTALVLKKNMFEVGQVAVGRMQRAWYLARDLGKVWYPSLKELVAARVREVEDEE
jgi:hypothetical protein